MRHWRTEGGQTLTPLSYTLIFSYTVSLRWRVSASDDVILRRNTSSKRYCTLTVKVYQLCILIRLCEHNKITCESSIIRYNIINYNSDESFRSYCWLIESIDGFAVWYAFIGKLSITKFFSFLFTNDLSTHVYFTFPFT